MSEEFTCVGWKCNELLYYWRGEYWRWTRSPMVKDDPAHVFESLGEFTDLTQWILNAQAIY